MASRTCSAAERALDVRPRSAPGEDAALQMRILAEYVEMPGLNLTLPQAARLFGADPIQCARVLDDLVEDGSLSMRGGTYRRAV